MYRYLVICVGLAACVTAGGEFASPVTGITGTYSRQVVISDHPHHVLFGHLVFLTGDDGIHTMALIISHRRDGTHSLRISEAWQDGRELAFRRLDRRLGCSLGHCRNDALGFITLGTGMVVRAAREGFSAHLIGPTGRIDTHTPAALFVDMASNLQLTDAP